MSNIQYVSYVPFGQYLYVYTTTGVLRRVSTLEHSPLPNSTADSHVIIRDTGRKLIPEINNVSTPMISISFTGKDNGVVYGDYYINPFNPDVFGILHVDPVFTYAELSSSAASYTTPDAAGISTVSSIYTSSALYVDGFGADISGGVRIHTGGISTIAGKSVLLDGAVISGAMQIYNGFSVMTGTITGIVNIAGEVSINAVGASVTTIGAGTGAVFIGNTTSNTTITNLSSNVITTSTIRANSMYLDGDLRIMGSTVTISAQTLLVDDNTIELNMGEYKAGGGILYNVSTLSSFAGLMYDLPAAGQPYSTTGFAVTGLMPSTTVGTSTIDAIINSAGFVFTPQKSADFVIGNTASTLVDLYSQVAHLSTIDAASITTISAAAATISSISATHIDTGLLSATVLGASTFATTLGNFSTANANVISAGAASIGTVGIGALSATVLGASTLATTLGNFSTANADVISAGAASIGTVGIGALSATVLGASTLATTLGNFSTINVDVLSAGAFNLTTTVYAALSVGTLSVGIASIGTAGISVLSATVLGASTLATTLGNFSTINVDVLSAGAFNLTTTVYAALSIGTLSAGVASIGTVGIGTLSATVLGASTVATTLGNFSTINVDVLSAGAFNLTTTVYAALSVGTLSTGIASIGTVGIGTLSANLVGLSVASINIAGIRTLSVASAVITNLSTSVLNSGTAVFSTLAVSAIIVGTISSAGSGSVYNYTGNFNIGTTYNIYDVILYKGTQYYTYSTIIGVAPDDPPLFLDTFSSYAGNSALTGQGPSGYAITYVNPIGGTFTTSAYKVTLSGLPAASVFGGSNQGNGFNPGVMNINTDYTMIQTGTNVLYYMYATTTGGTLQGHTHGIISGTNATGSGQASSSYATGDILRFTRTLTSLVISQALAASPTSFTTKYTITLTNGNQFADNLVYFAIPDTTLGISQIKVTANSAAGNTWLQYPFITGYPIANANVIDASGGLPALPQVADGRSGIFTLSTYSLGASTTDAGILYISSNSAVSTSRVYVATRNISNSLSVYPYVCSTGTGVFGVKFSNFDIATPISNQVIDFSYLLVN